MKATGIVRNIDTLNRITIPKEITRSVGIHDKTPLEIFVDGDSIILKKQESLPDVANTLNELIAGISTDIQTSDVQELTAKLTEALKMAKFIGI